MAYPLAEGARKLLYEFGVRELFRGYDFMLSDWCDGLMFGFRDLQDPESPADSEDLGATVRVLQAGKQADSYNSLACIAKSRLELTGH